MKYTDELLTHCAEAFASCRDRGTTNAYALCGAVLDAIPEPALPEWISAKERMPTEEDGDSEGEVLWRTEGGGIFVEPYDQGYSTMHWMPCAPIAALPKRPVPVPDDSDLRKEFAARLPEGENLTAHLGGFTDSYIESMFQGYKLAKQPTP
jgi:transcriptional regulator of met regulon